MEGKRTEEQVEEVMFACSSRGSHNTTIASEAGAVHKVVNGGVHFHVNFDVIARSTQHEARAHARERLAGEIQPSSK